MTLCLLRPQLHLPRLPVEAGAMLADLCEALPGGEAAAGDGALLAPDQLPPLARNLLVHRGHMTRVLAEHYDEDLSLRVLRRRRDGDSYRRQIALHCDGEAEPVEYGLVRIDLLALPPLARTAVLAARSPLGEVLIRHGVLRRVEPRWYLRFAAGGPMLTWFGHRGREEMYGRLATIHCNGRPAISLLEIVR